IYIDPPFDTGADFSSRTRVPAGVKKGAGPAVVEQRAYRDRWGLDAYLQWFSETVTLLRELLAERGSLYVHLDWRAAHHARVILDEVFGAECFRAEIVWRYRRWPVPTPNVQRMHDTLLYYARSPRVAPIFHTLYEPLAASTQQTFGTRRQVADFSSGRRKPSQLDQDSPGAPLSDVWDIGVIAPSGHERVGYPTQKPEALIERVLRLSSSEGDLVLDCFGGSGTTAVVAEKLGRRWIVADIGRLAVHTARRRLLALPELRPLVVQDLGPHERTAWLGASFASARTARAREEAGRGWLLERFGARPLGGQGGGHLHGRKGERWVHVGSRGEVTMADVK
ncbi:MAG: site-specific DNA-methyltransferase, partial [Myxococcales bacterium]